MKTEEIQTPKRRRWRGPKRSALPVTRIANGVAIAPILRARAIEIVDSAGHVRVLISPDSKAAGGEDYYTIEMFNPDGERSIMLRSWPGGGGALRLGEGPKERFIEGQGSADL